MEFDKQMFLFFHSDLAQYRYLVHTTQVNSTFRARWLASSEVISQVLFTSEQPKKNKVTLWAASYSACVVYTKTIIHLSVGESGGYLPSREAASLNLGE